MYNKLKELIKKENIRNIIILFIISIFICIPLLNTKLNIGYDDGVQHIARLMGTFQSITEKQNFSVIMSKFCNSFGYSWNIFYSPLTAYVPLIFRLITTSFVTCIKLFLFLITFLSALTMYNFVKEVSKNKKIAVVAAIFYLFAPYRFTDMYLRNALAELTTFVFLPMVFQGLYGILKQKPKREYILIIGAIGLILTHTIVTLYTAIICLIYLLTQIKELKNKKIQNKIIISLIFIIIITSFFWAPLLEHKLSTNYEVFKPGRMERTDVLVAFKLSFDKLFVTFSNSNMIYEIGLLSIAVLIFTPIVMKRLKKKCKNTDFYRFYKFSLITSIVLLIMTLNIFPFEHLPATLKMIQFSFRLLEFTSFFLAFVVSINIYVLAKKRIRYTEIIIITCVLVLLSLSFLSHLNYTDNLNEELLWPAVKVTAETGRVHAGCASFEYLPCKAFEHRNYIETREDKIIVLEGNVIIENQQKNGTNLICDISNVEEQAKLELPYIYYLGYEALIEQNGKLTKLETYETDNGFLGIILPKLENAKLKVSYEGTTVMKISTFISILGTIILASGFILRNVKKQKEIITNNENS